jgi:crotonobetainyl-CoA:carnitine CoA-transferase CaiB-like acyl-CoA transferase
MLEKKSNALEGIRILDLTIIAAGAGATMLLADMGAEVIKVESTAYIDTFRNSQIWPNNDPGEHPWNRAAPFNTMNRNKYSVTLDLKTERGKELFLELAKTSDIVAENFRVGVMDGFGLGYEAIKAVKPDIIMISVASQGIFGPESRYGSFGSTLDALAGLAAVTGYEGGPPAWSGPTVNYPDQLACTLAAGAALVGLHHRLRTGKGCYVDFSQRESITSLIGETLLDYSISGREPVRRGNADAYMVPHGCYPCTGDDEWVTIAVSNEDEWQRFCRAIDRPELLDDPRFAVYPDRYRNQADLDGIITEWTIALEPYEAFRILAEAGVPAGPVVGGKEVLEDAQLQARGFFQDVPQTEAGTFPIKTRPMKFSKTDGTIHMPAPLLGEHNDYILGEILGLSAAEIADLEREGIIGREPRQARAN